MKPNPVFFTFSLMFVSSAFCYFSTNGTDVGTEGGEDVIEEYIEALNLLKEARQQRKEDGRAEPEDPHTSLIDRVKKLRDEALKIVSESFLKTYIEVGMDIDDNESSGSNGQVSKRGISASENSRWTYGIIPYKFTEVIDKVRANEIKRAQLTWARFTCMRFVPWEKFDNGTTTNDLLDLGHQGHVKHVQSGGCWAVFSNVKSSDGQGISCCGGTACVHEYGHAMGLIHEQSSPDPNRHWLLRLNWDNMEDDSQYLPSNPKYNWAVNGYDYSTNMHYASWMFNKDGKPTFTTLFPEANVRDGKMHYMMMMVSLAHKCEQMNCSDVTVRCENDGYLTLVDGKCQCKCVEGLDPDTGCTSVINSRTSTQNWPGGNFALPKRSSDCADASARTGQVIFNNDGKQINDSFCVTEDSPNTDIWPAGIYCIHRVGGQCPEDFEEGFIELSNEPVEDSSQSSHTGTLPDGVFEGKTRFEYCCRDNGFTHLHLFLPMTKPFSLIRYRGRCQEIRGMHITEETTTLVDDEAVVGGAHPFSVSDRGYTQTICSYKPTNKDCGSFFELSKERPSVQFSSPSEEELDCYWFIKAPPGEHIRLSFEKFIVVGTQGDCKDTLGIQYMRSGHKLYTFCGDRMDRTFQSINNTITVHLNTIAGSPGSEFTATATLTLDEDLCYNAADRGVSYRGHVNFTRFFEPCLPWSEVTHCPYHPYKYSETGDNSILFEGNYCRNPDYATGIKPWCYTHKENCQRNYCDVCLYGKRYDSGEDCAKREENGLCSSEQYKSIAHKDCAKTCNVPLPEVPVRATEITCGTPPERVTDGQYACGNTAGPFTVGSKVTYKCDYLEVTRERICLTTGEWSSMNFVCDYCPNGWKFHLATKQCYGYFHKDAERMTLQNALQVCRTYGGEMVYPKDSEENEFLVSMLVTDTLIGVTDRDEEGVFKNVKGEEISYSNWRSGEPNDWYNEDCVSLKTNGYWNDRDCDDKMPYMCVRPIVGLAVCADHSDSCPEMLRANPSMCVDDENFAARTCPLTCGDCELHPDPWCSVGSAPDNSKILTNETRLRRGQVARFACEDGFVPVSGDAVRACAADGNLIGSPLECVMDCPEGWVYHRSTVSCYKFNTDPAPYATALENCRVIGSTLAMPETIEQNKMLNELSNANVWIGLNDKEEEDSFIWANEEPLIGWTHWSSGNPDNWGSGSGEDCVMIITNGLWNDASCTNKYPYICQFPLQAPTCTVEAAPANAELVTNATVVRQGAIVKYSCRDGFVPKSGEIERECGADGSFKGAPLQCVKDECPTGWMYDPVTKFCYGYIQELMDRNEAVQKCEEFNAILAMPKTQEELAAVLRASNRYVYSLWLYLDDIDEEGVFKWGDGTQLQWSKWNGDEPNNSGNYEDCAQTTRSGTWNDVWCRRKDVFVCQLSVKDTEP